MRISYNWIQEYFDKELPNAVELGKLLTMHAFEVESIEKVGNDEVLDIKVLPDRSHDCLSYIGIAREISLLANIPIKDSHKDLKEITAPESNVLHAEIEDVKKCRRFSALVIENIEVGESPDWLKTSLSAMGQRSVNNIVDVTNFVMFNTGQPLHAYDRDLLSNSDGWRINVRNAKMGEKLSALDNKDYVLEENDLIIVDGNADIPLGIAGIKGGKACEITNKTKHIILEAANFEPVIVRKTAKKLGLRTDASVRFENEITPELTLKALRQVSDLIFMIAKTENTQVEGLVDVYPQRKNLYKVGVSLTEINNVLGIDISEKEVESILNRRGYSWTVSKPRENFIAIANALIGTKYTFGASVLGDAPRSFDCSGLVAYCAMNVGISLPRMSVDQFVFCDSVDSDDVKPGDLIFAITKGGTPPHFESKEWMPGTPVPEGIDHVGIMISKQEVLHASMNNKDGVMVESLDDFLKIREIRGYKRIPTLDDEKRFVVTIPSERLDLRMKEDLIEEIGRIYGYEDLKAVPIKQFSQNVGIEKGNYYSNLLRNMFVSEGYSEVITYVFRNSGEVELQNPLASDKAFLRKNLTDGIAESVALNSRNKDLLGVKEIKIFEIGNVFTLHGEYTNIAFAGGNKEEIVEKIESIVGVKLIFVTNDNVHEARLEFDEDKIIEEVISYSVDDNFRFRSFSSYPFVLRDIAVFVPEEGDKNEIIDVVKKEGGELLVQYQNFDSFTKEFEDGKKTSYAYHLVFQSMDKTLTDDEINPIMNRVTEILNAKTGWQVR